MAWREWLFWAVPAVVLSGLMAFGAVIGQAKGRVDAVTASPVTVSLVATAPTYPLPRGLRFTSEVVADGAVGLGGYTVEVRYPPELLRLDFADVHPALRAAGRGSVEFEPVVDADRGSVRLAAVSCPADPCGAEPPQLPPPGAGGRLTLATLGFTTLAAGAGALAIGPAAAGDTGRRPQAVEPHTLPVSVLPGGFALTWYDTVTTPDADWLLAHSRDPKSNPVALRVGNRDFLDATMTPDNIWWLFYATVRAGPITFTSAAPERLRVVRRSYAGVPSELPAWPIDRLTNRWHLPPVSVDAGRREVLIANLNGLNARVTVSVAGMPFKEATVEAQSTLVVPLDGAGPGAVSVETTLPRDGSAVASLVTERVTAANGASIEVNGVPDSALRSAYLLPSQTEAATESAGQLQIANPGPAAIEAEVSVGGRPPDRVPLPGFGTATLPLANPGAVGAVVVRGQRAEGDATPAPILVAWQAASSDGLPLPAAALDDLQPEADFPWHHLDADPAQERLLLVNPAAEPRAYRVEQFGEVLFQGQLPANGLVTLDLPAGLKGAIWATGFDPVPPYTPRPIAGFRRVDWHGRSGILAGLPPPPGN